MKSSSLTQPAAPRNHPQRLRLRVLQNAFVLLGGQAALTVSSALTTLVMARRLGTEQFGEYNAVLAFIGLFLPIATFGLEIILVREMSQAPQQASEIFGTGLTLRLATSMVGIFLCTVSAFYFGYSVREMRLIGLWSLSLLFSTGQLFQAPFALGLNNLRPVKVTAIVTLIGTLIKLPMILARMQLGWYLCMDLLVSILTSVLLWRAVQLHCGLRPQWTGNWQVWKRLLRACFPLLVSGVFVAIYHRIDQQFLLMWRGAQELGQYAAAVRLAELLSLFPVFLMRSAFPIISRAVTGSDAARPLKISSTCYRYLFLATFPPIFIGMTFAPAVIGLLYGSAYSKAASALPWLLIAEIPIIGGVVYGHFSVASKLQRYDVLFTFISVFSNLILCGLLIPAYGLVGAAVASAVSYGIGTPLQLFFRATRPYSLVLIREVMRFLAVGFVTWLSLKFCERVMSPVTSLLLTTGVFTIAALQLKLITRQDVRSIFA